MRKVFLSFFILILPLIVSGCSSNVIAKFDDYNETFSGKSYYDPMIRRATIIVKSDTTDTICNGNAMLWLYPMWQFKLTCSDGRMVQGTLKSATTEGEAFTNRNELITFSVAKKQTTIKKVRNKYNSEIFNKPQLDKKKVPIQVIMQE